MSIIGFLLSIGLLHWIAACISIALFLFVRAFRVKNFSWHKWIHENLISTIWSVFILSIVIPMIYIYFPAVTISEGGLLGYVGTHWIFLLTKPQKTHCRTKPRDFGFL
jgi:hypothetical protein